MIVTLALSAQATPGVGRPGCTCADELGTGLPYG